MRWNGWRETNICLLLANKAKTTLLGWLYIENGKYIGFDELYSKSAAAGVMGANPIISTATSKESLKSAMAGVMGVKLVRSMFVSAAKSLKSASRGIVGAKVAISTVVVLMSSKAAPTGVIGARQIITISFATGAEIFSFPAKTMPELSVRTAAKIVTVAFILFCFSMLMQQRYIRSEGRGISNRLGRG